MIQIHSAFQAIEGYRDNIIHLQSELTSKVALSPENGGSGEHAKADYLRGKLEELRPDYLEEIRAPDNRAQAGYRPNVVAHFKGETKGPTVWVLSHMDIVPPGDLTLWNSDPYRAIVEDNKIIGRGVEDNQHGIVSSYLAVKAALESPAHLPRSVGLAFVADEETGSKFGLDYLLTHHRELFKSEDLIIVPDGGNNEGTMIEVAEKSMLWMKFTIIGQQCHASTPEKGKNSLYGAARLIMALERLKKEYNLADDVFSPPLSTFEPTKIEANVPNINTIPGKNIFYMDCRILPSYGVDDIILAIKGIVDDLVKELNLTIHLEPVHREDAVDPTPVDAPVVKALARAIKHVKGLKAKPMGIGGGTVASFFRRAGLPAAVWSTTPDTAHQPNEYCLISNIISDTKVFAFIYLEI